MARLSKFENYRFIGNRKNMKVYDCDDEDQFSKLQDLIKKNDLILYNLLQSFAPDTISEAKNRGFKPL